MCFSAKFCISGKSPARLARERIAVAVRETARVSAILIVIGAACIAGTATGLASPINEAGGSSEPFGLPTPAAPQGALVTKWRNVEPATRRAELLVARCGLDPRTCG